MLFKAIVEYSRKVKQVSSRNVKVSIIAELLGKLSLDEAIIGVSYISGRIRQGKLNLTWKAITELSATAKSRSRSPTLVQVDRYLEAASSASGRSKTEALEPLFAVLDHDERKYLISLIIGEVVQGAGEGVVKQAIAQFFGLSDDEIERAYLQKPDIAGLFHLLRRKGKNTIDGLGIRIFSPVKPMLAQIADSIDDIFDEQEEFALEHKFDGIRIQVHRQGDEVKIFSRHLKDITSHFPELVQNARRLPVERFILDGEAIGIDKQGRPVPFQILARRTTRKKNIMEMQIEVPVLPRYFDALYVDGDDLTGKAYDTRARILSDMIHEKDNLAARLVPISRKDARVFYEQSLKCGNEGVVVKMLDSEYRPGKRGKYWFKIKSAHTIDCVILAAEWGHGRRHGLLSNLHLGVLDETKTKYLMVGKTFKGLTDSMLRWMTANLPKHKVHEDRWTVYVKPVVVVEIAFNDVQKSPKYESGAALRFARVKRIREDKAAQEVNTIVDLDRMTAGSYESS